MKIDLTKEEWQFLKSLFNRDIDFSDIPCFETKYRFECEKSFENILNKLGDEWIDEEEEMRKFREGFAYRKRVKND